MRDEPLRHGSVACPQAEVGERGGLGELPQVGHAEVAVPASRLAVLVSHRARPVAAPVARDKPVADGVAVGAEHADPRDDGPDWSIGSGCVHDHGRAGASRLPELVEHLRGPGPEGDRAHPVVPRCIEVH